MDSIIELIIKIFPELFELFKNKPDVSADEIRTATKALIEQKIAEGDEWLKNHPLLVLDSGNDD